MHDRRTARDWLSDSVLFLAALLYAAGWYFSIVDDPGRSRVALGLIGIVSLAACCSLWLRRRWPVGLALVLIPVSTVVDIAAGAQLVALFTVAIHRPVRTTALVCALRVLAVTMWVPWRAPENVPVGWIVGFAVMSSIGVVGWGLFIRHRRQLILSLKERAVRAEVEARLRAEQAQHVAREQIAREMHDVLGHRLSLLSVHAGALEYRPDAPPTEIARAAAVIRESAHQAMQDLREVIGVLRAPVGEPERAAKLPQPTYADIPALVAESRRGGVRVKLSGWHEPEAADEVPESLGRTAYRIVQEALTNVRKHAFGAEVSVAVAGTREDGLSVEVRNGPAPQTYSANPEREATSGGIGPETGSGYGLPGLVERAGLAGGRLEYGPAAGGGFAVSAWLPWPS